MLYPLPLPRLSFALLFVIGDGTHGVEQVTGPPLADVSSMSSNSPWVYACEIFFSSAPSKSFPQCTATDDCKGGEYGINVGALSQGWRLWFQSRSVVYRMEAIV